MKVSVANYGLIWALACAIIGAAASSHAQSLSGESFPACYDYRHMKVQLATTPSMAEGPAFSTWDQSGRPLIVFNERELAQIAHSEAMVMFVFEHECGHHVLGHIDGTETAISHKMQLQKELDADCYAAHQLRSMKYSITDITDVIDDVYPWPRDPEHPSGKTRSKHLMECYEGHQ